MGLLRQRIKAQTGGRSCRTPGSRAAASECARPTILDVLNLLWVRCDAAWRHLEPQVLHGGSVKFTLVRFGVQLVLAKLLQHLPDMVIVLRHTVGVNEDVVQIDNH